VTRRYATGAARQDALLDAAEGLLTTVGHAQTSIRAVAAAVTEFYAEHVRQVTEFIRIRQPRCDVTTA
jgi:hypothetical protein